MGRKWTVLLAALFLLVGLGVLLYPAVSSTVNRRNGSFAIAQMQEQVGNLNDAQLEAALEEARAYNEQLLSGAEMDEEALLEQYERILDFGNGIMGYIQIPEIDLELPIYHGVTTEVLDRGVGHLPQSAFPVGGVGNHTVLTGHTGLPSAKLFTDLNLVEEGDRFSVSIGNRTGVYQVDQIKVVLPSETDDLSPQPGADYCTLVTCTPYGINSHRLLVRGVREPAEEDASRELAEAEKARVQPPPGLLAAAGGAGMILICMLAVILKKEKR